MTSELILDDGLLLGLRYSEYEIQAARLSFKYAADMSGQAQLRGTRMIKGLSELCYEDKLRCLNLFTPGYGLIVY